MSRPDPGIPDPHFDSRRELILKIWDDMQRLQTDFCLPQELAVYYGSKAWRSANRVLDLGTGNGYYLGKLAKQFPSKQFRGIDSSIELINIATESTQLNSLEFKCVDLMNATGHFDYAILRLLIQHLNDIPNVLSKLAELVDSGGSVLVIDAYDPSRLYVPELPEFTSLFAAYTESELKHGRDRRFAESFAKSIESSTDWDIVINTRLLIPSTVGNNMELFRQTYLRLIDLVEAAGELQYDFDSVRAAFKDWVQQDGAYTQVGLSMIELTRS